jgi:hypothetical protein
MACYIEFMRLRILGLLVLLLGTGCLVEKRTLMSGWHVERTHRAEVMVQSNEVQLNEAWPEHQPTQPQHRALQETEEIEQTLARATQPRRGYVQALPLQSVRPLVHYTATKNLKRSRTRSADGIEIDRPTSVTLITLGAAALMWGYTSFSFLGWAIVFLASIVATPLVHSLIWGERMTWESSRLGRIALSLVLSGLVLSGAMALVANLLGWVF